MSERVEMSITISPEMREWILSHVHERGYGSVSAYFQRLVTDDQDKDLVRIALKRMLHTKIQGLGAETAGRGRTDPVEAQPKSEPV